MSALNSRTLFRVLIVYALGVLAAMTVSEAVPQLDAIARDLHPRTPATIGLIMSLPSLVVALGALLAGYLVDKFGDKLILTVGGITLAVGDAIVAAAPNMQVLLTGRVVSGLGYLMMAVSAITLLIRITSGKQRTMALALWSTFVPVSFILPFVTAKLVEASGSWRFSFAGHAAVLLAVLALGFFELPAWPPEMPRFASRTSGLMAVLRSPLVYLLGISFGADAFLHTGIISTLAPYLHTQYGADPMQINLWNVGAMVMNAAGCLLLGRLLTRDISPLGVCFVAIVVTGVPALLIYSLGIGLTASLACSWILMFGSGVLTGMWAFVPSVAPSMESIGATGGLITQLTLLGVLLSGPAFFSAEASPNRYALLTVVAVALVFCLFRIPILIRRGRGAIPAGEAISVH